MFGSILKGLKFISGYQDECCPICRESFGFSSKYKCNDCRVEVCSDCKTKPRYLYKEIACRKCNTCSLTAMKTVVLVKSSHVGGHKITRKFGEIHSEFTGRNYDETTDNLKYQAIKMGANGIVELKNEKSTHSETTKSGGSYYFSMWTSTGIPVQLEKK